jgi:hypothetical protein
MVSFRMSASLTATSSTLATSALVLLAPTHMSPPPLVCGRYIYGNDIGRELQSPEWELLMSARPQEGPVAVLIQAEALSRISAHAGCNARTEPTHTSVGVAAVGRQGALADMEVTLPRPMIPPCWISP